MPDEFTRADSDRLARIETTLVAVAERDADLVKRADDHEQRLRKIERALYIIVGLAAGGGAAVGSAIGSAVGQLTPPL